MKVPFLYGSIAEKENFIDRTQDRQQLKMFLGSGINVMLISPRRWGNAQTVVAAYGLGAPRTITNNKRVLIKRDFVEQRGDTFSFVDPVFALWFRRENLRQEG